MHAASLADQFRCEATPCAATRRNEAFPSLSAFGNPGLRAECARRRPPPRAEESQELSHAVGEAGNSPVDFIRALEKHLAKYPNTTRRNEIERALVKAAIEAKDDKRIIEYGERVLAREPGDAQILDKVVRALLVTERRAIPPNAP